MFQHDGFGFLEGLDFQDGGRASDRVGRGGSAQDQPLATQRFDLGESFAEMVLTIADFVLDDGRVRIGVVSEPCAGEIQTLLEPALGLRGVEDHVPHRLPAVVRRRAADDTHRIGKFLPPDPQFPIQGNGRKILGEPLRRGKGVARPGHKPLARPIAAHAVQFLAHPPPLHVHARLPDLRQHGRGGLRLGGPEVCGVTQNEKEQGERPCQAEPLSRASDVHATFLMLLWGEVGASRSRLRRGNRLSCTRLRVFHRRRSAFRCWSQFSTRSLGTCPKPFSSFVTSVASRLRACAAMSRSLAPMGRPFLTRAWRTSP